jgi:hypothetical protein
MWNKASRAPLWIIAVYAGGMISVWSFILLIMLKLRDVFVIGKTVLKKAQENPDLTI